VLAELWRNRLGALSTQVLEEFYVVASRKFDPPMPRRQARDLVEAYSNWRLIQIDVPLVLAASQLEERHTLSFWDALVLEAARRAGATRLISEDLQVGRRLGGVLIDNPFASTS
jgi:predicted nucleic acid-binding protein